MYTNFVHLHPWQVNNLMILVNVVSYANNIMSTFLEHSHQFNKSHAHLLLISRGFAQLQEITIPRNPRHLCLPFIEHALKFSHIAAYTNS